MPTIDIKEVDISTVSSVDVTTNATYVLGYAIQGPVNEPTLCRTLEEFQEIFGSTPYRFENDSPSKSSNKWVYSWKKGQPEKSYIYAADLLRLGLPVLFERVNGSDTYAQTTGTNFAIKARYPGRSYGQVYFELSVSDVGTGGNHAYVYAIKVGRFADKTLGITEIQPVITYFTFNEKYSQTNPKYKYQTFVSSINDPGFVDNSGLVQIAFTGNVSDSVAETRLTYTQPVGSVDFTPAAIYTYLSNDGLDPIKDRNEYVIKFITAGGYPTLFNGGGQPDSIYAQKLLNIAVSRKDVTALIDYDINLDNGKNPLTIRQLAEDWLDSLPKVDNEEQGNYGAIFTPWGTFNSPTVGEVIMAPSFAYLSALANSTQTYTNWFAVAGVTRGFVPNLLSTSFNISDAVGNDLQPKDGVAINPIQLIRPYGYRIWGSRTLRQNEKYGGLMATSFLNIRQLANDIKRAVYVASKECMFEPDDDVLWINYKSKITPILDRMAGNRGLSTYIIRRAVTSEKATLKAIITAYCVDPVENFDITLELSDDQITVTE